MAKSTKKQISSKESAELIKTLKSRFEKNMHRHKGVDWNIIQSKIEENPDKMWSLHQMEITGGEPDVIGFDKKKNEVTFCDCSAETPKGRRSVCYDREALDSRKEFKPANTALDMAAEMGIEILNEEQYRKLQELEAFDTKTSSWILTPDAIRKHGGAIFADRRYEHIFVYHNGASSYYAARAFRGMLIV